MHDDEVIKTKSLSIVTRTVEFLISRHFTRSSRVEPPDLAGMLRSTDDIIESLVCPPPPSDPAMMSEEMISGLIVPAPNWRKWRRSEMGLFNYLKFDYFLFRTR